MLAEGGAEQSETGSKNKQVYKGIVNIDEDSLVLFGQPFLSLWIQSYLQFGSPENFSVDRKVCPLQLQFCKETYCVWELR